ncbi:MAG: DUF4278 domain-containing protein [Paracoccaceae bacterium]|jgi:hypothetical protein|nr:DUF4278 domain-containing protein [Paracoccaceae bacterium]
MTTLIYRGTAHTKPETAIEAPVPAAGSMIYRGQCHDGVAVARQRAEATMCYRGIAYRRMANGKATPTVGTPAPTTGALAH